MYPNIPKIWKEIPRYTKYKAAAGPPRPARPRHRFETPFTGQPALGYIQVEKESISQSAHMGVDEAHAHTRTLGVYYNKRTTCSRLSLCIHDLLKHAR